jgi:CHAT domain-containing protein
MYLPFSYMKIRLLFLSLIVLLSVPDVQAQDTLPKHFNYWGQPFDKAESYYSKEDYKRAEGQILSIAKVIAEKNDKSIEAWHYANEAKYKDGLGKFKEMNEKLLQAVSILNQQTIPTPQTAMAWLAVSKSYNEYGYPAKALEYVLKARETAAKQKTDTTINLLIDCHYADVLWQVGSIEESLALINKIAKNASTRSAMTKVTYQQLRKGKLQTKTRKLKRYELQLYQSVYPQLMLSKARALAKKGEKELAEPVFNEVISKTDSRALLFTNLKAKYYLAVMKQPDTEENDNIKAFEAIKKSVKKKFNLIGKFSFEVHQSLIQNYWTDKEKKDAKDVSDDLDDEVKKRSKFYKNWSAEIEQTEKQLASENIDKVVNDYLKDYYEKKLPTQALKNIPPKADPVQFIIDNPVPETETYLDNGDYAVPLNHPRGIRIFTKLYELALANDDAGDPGVYLQQVVFLKKLLYGANSREFEFTKLKVADYYVNVTEDLKAAETIFDKSLQTAKIELAPQNPDLLQAQTALAKLYDNTERYKKALDILQDEVKILSRKGEKENYGLATILSTTASVQIKAGQYKDAETNIEKAITIFKAKRAGRRTLNYLRALQTKARLYTIYGFYNEAEDLLEDSDNRKVAKTIKTKNISIKSFDDIALLKIKQGKYAEVEEPLTQSISATEKRYGNIHRNLIAPLTYRAILNLEKGEYVVAEQEIKRASDIATRLFGANSDKNADCLVTLGQVQENLGDFDKAEQSFRKAIQIINTNRGENHILSVSPLLELASVRFEKNKNLKEAEQTLTLAKEIVAKSLGTDSPLYADVQKHFADIYIEADKLDEAIYLLNEANNIWIKKVGKTNKNTADVLTRKGDLYSKKKDFKNAELSYDNAKSMYEKIFNDRYPAYNKVVGRLGRMYYIKGDTKKALDNLEQSTKFYLNYLKKIFPSRSESEKAKFWNAIRGDFEFFNTLAIKLQSEKPELIEKMYNFQLATKAILLSSSVRVREKIMSSRDTLLKSKYAEWTAKKEYLNTVLALNTEQMKELKVNPDDIEAEIEKIEQDLSQRSGAFSDAYNAKNYDWSNIKAKLKENETAVEIIRFRYFSTAFSDSVLYAALVVTPQTRKQPDLIVLKNGNELETKYLNFYRNAIKARRDDKISYRQFWEPLEKSVKPGKIYFSPDGVYNQLNPDAIQMSDGSYVIDKYNIVFVSNTKDLLAKEEKKTPNPAGLFVFIGNPTYCTKKDSVECSIPSLPGAENEVKEAQEIAKKNGKKVLAYVENETGTDEENLKKMKHIQVLHLATHGYFQPDNKNSDELSEENASAKATKNPLLRSGLMLKGGGDVLASKQPGLVATENGILTANEAMNLDLDETELVLLSACETGLGEVQVGEGVFGLQRAFIVAGADAVVMSLFKVNDEVTQKLMTKFYEKWFVTRNKRQAFLQARKEVKEEYKSPLYWGAFNMIGLE